MAFDAPFVNVRSLDAEDSRRRLCETMSAISDRCHGTDWHPGMEYVLWDIAREGAQAYGQDEVTPDDIATLRTLSQACGGWIACGEDDLAPTFLPRETWLDRLDLYASV